MTGLSSRRVLMVGCGALGGALLQRLNQAAEMTVLDPSVRPGVLSRVWRKAEDLTGKSFDGIIVVTKCYDLNASVRALKGRVHAPRMLLMQNGIVDIAAIARLFPGVSIVRGVTTSAAGIIAGKPIFHFQGAFYLAPQAGIKNETLRWFGSLLTDASLKTSLFAKPQGIIWAKLIFSALMNPLPVITGQGYEILRKDPKVWGLARQAIDEGRLVARELGIRLAFDPMKLISRVRHGDLAGIPHLGSIHQDISKRRQTELEFITGALVREAKRAGIQTPALKQILQRARAGGA